MGPVRHDKGPRIWWDSYGVQQGLGRVTPVVGLGKGSEEEWDPCGAQGGAGGTGGPVCGAQGGVGRVDSVWGTVRIERVLSQQQDLQGGEFTGDKTGPEPPGPNPGPVEGPGSSRSRGHSVSLPGPQPGQPLPAGAVVGDVL